MNDSFEPDNNQNTPPAGPLQPPPAAEAAGGNPVKSPLDQSLDGLNDAQTRLDAARGTHQKAETLLREVRADHNPEMQKPGSGAWNNLLDLSRGMREAWGAEGVARFERNKAQEAYENLSHDGPDLGRNAGQLARAKARLEIAGRNESRALAERKVISDARRLPYVEADEGRARLSGTSHYLWEADWKRGAAEFELDQLVERHERAAGLAGIPKPAVIAEADLWEKGA